MKAGGFTKNNLWAILLLLLSGAISGCNQTNTPPSSGEPAVAAETQPQAPGRTQPVDQPQPATQPQPGTQLPPTPSVSALPSTFPSPAPSASSIPVDPSAGNAPRIEIFAYINADADLISDTGGAQGVVFAKEIAAEAALLGERATLKMYLDPNSYLAKPDEETGTVISTQRAGQVIESQNLGETNSSDPSVFADFVSNIQADSSVYRILIIWGHGEGWRRVGGFDFSHPDSLFSYQDIASRVAPGAFNLVVFDACKMATLETVSAWKSVTPSILASQMKLPVEGIRYAGMAETLQSSVLNSSSFSAAATTVAVYEKLKKNTFDFHKIRGMNAYTVLLHSAGISEFNESLRTVLQQLKNSIQTGTTTWTDVAKASKPGFMLSFAGSDVPTVDLRALLNTMKVKAQISASDVLEKYKKLSNQGYGSVSLFFPELNNGSQIDSTEVQYSKNSSWTQGLANWEINN